MVRGVANASTVCLRLFLLNAWVAATTGQMRMQIDFDVDYSQYLLDGIHGCYGIVIGI